MVNHAGKSYWQGKFGEEKFGEQAPVSGYGIYTFRVSVNISKENFG